MQETVTGEQTAAGPTAAPVLLEVCDLSFGRDDIPLFSDLHLRLSQGQILLIEGDNGSGKTTLLRLLCGLLEPWAGEIRWEGRDVRTCYPDYLQSLCYIGHGNGVKHGLTARENLAVALALSGLDSRPDLAGILRRFGLDQHADAPAQTLSAGQRRRLALARLLLGGKRLWILDEPLTALDAAGRTMLKAIFNEHLDEGGTVIMTSHDPFSLEGAPLVRMRL